MLKNPFIKREDGSIFVTIVSVNGPTEFFELKDFKKIENSNSKKIYYFRVNTKRIPRRGDPSRNEYCTYQELIFAESKKEVEAYIRRHYGYAGHGNGEGSFIRDLQRWKDMHEVDKEYILGCFMEDYRNA